MDWKKFVDSISLVRERMFLFKEKISQSTLDNLKNQFSLHELPPELIELFEQTDGIDETFNGEKIGELIWSAQKIIDTNIEFRNNKEFKELYMSFDQLLFFSDVGNGDMFAFITLNGLFDRNDIFLWNHETDSRTWAARDLKTFIEWELQGKLTV